MSQAVFTLFGSCDGKNSHIYQKTKQEETNASSIYLKESENSLPLLKKSAFLMLSLDVKDAKYDI